MILQALNEYYERKAADANSGTAPEGFGWEDIPFVIVIDGEGTFLSLEDTRTAEGKRLKAKEFLVPKAVQRSGVASYEHSNLLWDHVGYVLGHPKSDSIKDRELASKQLATWLRNLRELPPPVASIPVLSAMLQFYETDESKRVFGAALWADVAKVAGCKIAFRLDGDQDIAPCKSAVHGHVKSRIESKAKADLGGTDQREGVCLVTGVRAPIARTHTKTPINKDANTLVGFQRSSGYDSYGKEQAFNAPVSVSAEFRYTEALNILLNSERNRMRVGDSTAVFWSEKKTQLEELLPLFFSTAKTDDPDEDVAALKALYNSVHSGAQVLVPDTRFYVLGLATGGGSRICVRFWQQSTVEIFRTPHSSAFRRPKDHSRSF